MGNLCVDSPSQPQLWFRYRAKLEPGNETACALHGNETACALHGNETTTIYLLQVSGELLCEDLEDFDFSFETPPMSTGGTV